jgi:hypothetical protein
VLEHVHREVRVRPLVHRADEREDRGREAEREERESVPAGEIGAPASAETPRAVQEEERRDCG